MSFPFRYKMNVAGHRGDCHNYFENTMEAFRAAYGARLVTTNDPAGIIKKLKELGLRE